MVTSAQLRGARAMLGWTVRELAEHAGVHRNSVTRAETAGTQPGHAVDAMTRAMAAAGITFLDDDGIVLLKPKAAKRRR